MDNHRFATAHESEHGVKVREVRCTDVVAIEQRWLGGCWVLLRNGKRVPFRSSVEDIAGIVFAQRKP